MLKIGIVGCGKIADSHALQIQRIAGCRIVGACDRELLMAKQFCDRFDVEGCFAGVEELVNGVRPDVVHITTPPVSHFPVAKFCLESGCHVYVEKPFTLDAAEAEILVGIAESRGMKLTVGHNYQFTPAARRMRTAIEAGYLGGNPLHMESIYGYDLGNPSYARALLGDKQHWVRRLPGKLAQNIISHGIARIAEHITDEDPSIVATGESSALLRSMGENQIIDEIRVLIRDKGGATAYFTFSSQIKPVLHEFRVFGPKNSIVLDQNHEVVLRLNGQKFKSYADYFIPPIYMARQQMSNWLENLSLFIKRDFHMDSGLKCLIESFYQAIVENIAVPISYREILLTARIMDKIFQQMSAVETGEAGKPCGRYQESILS